MIEAFTSDPQVKMMLPIVFNVIFFVASLVLCHFIDQHFCRKRVLHYTYVCLIFLGVPIYALQTLDHWAGFVLSQCLITLFVASIVSITPSVLFDASGHQNRIVVIGLGINLGVTFITGFVPMVVSILVSYGQVYIGLLMSAGACIYLLAQRINTQTYAVQTMPRTL
jgi:hypothetical protein